MKNYRKTAHNKEVVSVAKLAPGPVPLGNVVKDYYIGKTHVIICDDAYRNRTIEEQRKSLDNLSRIASEALRNQMIAEALRKEQNGM